MRLSRSLPLAIACALLIVPPAHATSDAALVRHALARLTYGASPGDVERVQSAGLEAYIAEQLDQAYTPEPPALQAELKDMEGLNSTPAQLWQRYDEGLKDLSAPERKARREAGNKVEQGVRRARILRALESPHQLREVMTAFWFDHFNVYDQKGPVRLWIGNYEEAIRANALGRFRDLVGAVAQHPAMLFYLDNFQSAGPPNPNKPGKRQGLNENFAREVMELHTLGVNGGYTQGDVTELARILTGWGFKPQPRQDPEGYSFYFNPKRHDGGTKTLLGTTFAPDGQNEGERALDLLVQQPATARHIARQLCEFFIADNPPPAAVDKVAAAFQASNGDIKTTLRALIYTPEFWQAPYRGNKFKTPYQYVLSAARAVEPNAPEPDRLLQNMRNLGQPLYDFLTPDGYKNVEVAWLSPEAMIQRTSFAVQIASGRLGQKGFPKRGLDPQALAHTLGDPFGAQTLSAVDSAAPRLRPALMLASPEFNRR